MMKKLLLSLGFVLMATIASMSQFTNEISNVVISPESAGPGEDVTITFDYVAADEGFFRIVFSNNADAATFWVDDNTAGVEDWANLLDAPVGDVIGATIAFTIPLNVVSGERPFQLRMEESVDASLDIYEGTYEVATPAFRAVFNSYSVPAMAESGEEVTLDVNYTNTSEEDQDALSFMILSIDGVLDWDGAGAIGWTEPSATFAPGAEVDGTITYTIPADATPSADLAEGTEWRLISRINGFEYSEPIEVLAPDFIVVFNSYSIPAEAEVGEEVTLDVNYTNTSEEDQDALSFMILSIDGVLDWDGDGVIGWTEPSATFAPGTEVDGTITYTIPADATPSADLAEGTEWRLISRINGFEYSEPITVIGADFFLSIDNITAPASADIDEDIIVSIDYTNEAPDDVSATISLIRWNTVDDVPADDNGWITAGFIEDIASLSSIGVGMYGSQDVTFNISAAEATLSADLPEGEEWRIYVKVGAIEDFSTQIVINGEGGFNRIRVVSPAADYVFNAGDTLIVEVEYSAVNDAEIELALLLFEDQFTPVSPEVSVSQERFIVDLPASTVVGELTTVFDTLFVNGYQTFTTSANLIGTQNYQVVAKLLDPSKVGEEAFLLQSASGSVTGLFNNKSESASFNAYPNPSANGTVRFSTEISNMIVVDAIGNVVKTAESATELNTSSLESGFYLLKSDQGSVRLVVE